MTEETLPISSPSPAAPEKPAETTLAEKAKAYIRFALDQRIEHAVLLISFTTLAITGLPQKFPTAGISQWVVFLLGGIEFVRIIHRFAAAALITESVYHLLALIYRLVIKRQAPTMLPTLQDIQHLIEDVLLYVGLRKHGARYGRYNYAEKAEYYAVVWGTIVMVITGFMMWNPIATVRILPGEWIPVAKAAHGGEAILAVLAIMLWHFYHVHLRHLNRSMFTGKLTREEMQHEHPAELMLIDAGRHAPDIPAPVLKRRRQIFFPMAGTVFVVLGVGLIWFATFEQSAITTVPPRETIQVYVPVTPTPQPPTPTPGKTAAQLAWTDNLDQLFRNRCSTCHGRTKVGGLTLATYADALKGGQSGPAIVPGDPEASVLIKIQRAGGHPGQLTEQELAIVIDWIKAGAPEK